MPFSFHRRRQPGFAVTSAGSLVLCRSKMNFTAATRGFARPGRRVCWSACLLALFAAFHLSASGSEPDPAAKRNEFSELVKLAPFVVNGQSTTVSVFARTKSDRRYGEEFAERVVKVVSETMTESTGRGLVVVGAKGEPHPFFVFRKFVALANEGKLDPGVATLAKEVSAMLDSWQKAEGRFSRGKGESISLDFDQILTALPMPLGPNGAKIYQLAWEEKFDDARVEAKLIALRPGDLERRDLFAKYEWVFYLPPKGVAEHVLDDVIAEVMKKEKLGLVKRMAVKTVLLVVKPKIRRAIEGVREGFLFSTVVRARTHYTQEQAFSLAEAYVSVFVPTEKKAEDHSSDHERAVKAVRDRLRKIEEKEKAKSEAGTKAQPPSPESDGAAAPNAEPAHAPSP
jgi:hypothetical protein